MEMFVTLKILPDHVIDAVQDGVRNEAPQRVKGLSRREKRRIRDARKGSALTIAFLEDARDSIDARTWARKNIGEGTATHDRAAQGIKVPYPLTVPFLIVDTGERKRPAKVVKVKVPYSVPILDEGVEYLQPEAAYSSTLKRWEYAARRAAREEFSEINWER
jgi:hypothetical protein